MSSLRTRSIEMYALKLVQPDLMLFLYIRVWILRPGSTANKKIARLMFDRCKSRSPITRGKQKINESTPV
jgi:hypothetical protein